MATRKQKEDNDDLRPAYKRSGFSGELVRGKYANILNDPRVTISTPTASEHLEQGVRYTIMRMNERDAAGIRQYYWSAIIGTDRSIPFADDMRAEGFIRFEEILDEFRRRFGNEWLH